jgi:hypothetical protein
MTGSIERHGPHQSARKSSNIVAAELTASEFGTSPGAATASRAAAKAAKCIRSSVIAKRTSREGTFGERGSSHRLHQHPCRRLFKERSSKGGRERRFRTAKGRQPTEEPRTRLHSLESGSRDHCEASQSRQDQISPMEIPSLVDLGSLGCTAATGREHV